MSEPLRIARTNDAGYVRQIAMRTAELQKSVASVEATLAAAAIKTSAAPSPVDGSGLFWLANSSGTKDGQAYDPGDLLYSANIGETTKTVLVIDWSAA